MNRKQKNRLYTIVVLAVIVSIAMALILYALKQNINLFYTPTQLVEAKVSSKAKLRVGGYVKNKSVHYDKSGESVSFVVTDRKQEITVRYHGVLPSLFREGQGIVVDGNLLQPTLLIATEVLAKHDEKYMPKSVARELEREK